MRYAKLNNGTLLYAPNPVLYGSNYVGNPPAELLWTLGWKPVHSADLPAEAPQAGCRWEPVWTETAEAIEQSWAQAPIPPDEELEPEEALSLLLGGEG